MAMGKRAGQIVQENSRFTRPFYFEHKETYSVVWDNKGKVVAQGSIHTMKNAHPDTLPAPFAASPPSKNAKDKAIAIQVDGAGGLRSLHNFAAMYAAKHWVNA